MAAITVARRQRRGQRACGRRERIFPPHVFIYCEHQKNTLSEHRLPSHVIFYLLQDIKDEFEHSTRIHAIPARSKLLASSAFFFSTNCEFFIYLFFICDYAN